MLTYKCMLTFNCKWTICYSVCVSACDLLTFHCMAWDCRFVIEHFATKQFSFMHYYLALFYTDVHFCFVTLYKYAMYILFPWGYIDIISIQCCKLVLGLTALFKYVFYCYYQLVVINSLCDYKNTDFLIMYTT